MGTRARVVSIAVDSRGGTRFQPGNSTNATRSPQPVTIRGACAGGGPGPHCDRPPLTKKFMTGEIDDTSLRADLGALGTDLRLAEAATSLRDGTLVTDKAEYGFDVLVVATGATPVRLPGPGPQRVLRTFDHAAPLRSVLRPGLKLAVVGAGWIGAELATSAAR